jgi:glucan biosynthesis protein C
MRFVRAPRAANLASMTSPLAPASRLYFLDWLRIAAFGVLIVYHVGMYYVSWDFHVKSPAAGPTLEPWMRMSSPWRLSLLFLVSGAATSLMLLRGAGGGFMRGRSTRLLLPLVFGMLVIVPPQPYFEVVQKAGYGGSYLEFLGLYFTGYGGFCRNGQCLILPTWNHLWFVAYLWVYTLLLWALLRLRPNALDALARVAARALAGPALIALPIAALALVRIALGARFPSTHALVDDWFNHAMYFGMFVTGAVFARAPGIWPRLEQWRWFGLGVAAAAWVAIYFYAGLYNAKTAPEWLRVVYASMQWCAIVAAIGFAHRHLNRDHRLRRYLTEAVFPVYIVHQTFIIVLTQLLAPLHWSPAYEGPLLVTATFALSFASFEAVRRLRVLRPWFGLAPLPAPERAQPRDAAAARP